MVSTFPPSLQPQPSGAVASSSSSGAAAAAGAASVTATTAVAATSAEEEAFKRNTDCVYFLASPLTCKKGSECEYRHSDVARVNPRDCWYWLHGNCLNPKCGFRHPPLDGLLGTQMPNPMGTSLPASQPATAPAAPVPYASGKQAVACIFFQKGNCLKGDWCPFSHAPNSANSKVVQSHSAIPTIEPLTFKKNFGDLEKCTQEKKITQTSMRKSAELNPQAKPVAKVESTPAKKEINKSLLPSGVEHELHGYRPVDIRPTNNGNRVTGASRVQQPLLVNNHADTLNVKDPEEVSREPSPGFDVLVDNELGDSDYYHREDHFGITRDHEGMNEYYDGRRSGDYSPLVDADRDVYRDSRGYDSYEGLQGHYASDQRRSSLERVSGVLPHPERRRHGRADSLDQIDESDLRHQLSKHRRVNGLRSVINHDYTRERPDGRGHQSSRRDLHHECDGQESSLGNRLRGRIKIPGMSSSPTVGGDLRHSRETERRRERSGSSPRRSQVSSRLQDRIKGRVHEDFNNDLRNSRCLRMTTEMLRDDDTDFAAPKSLAELKSRKNADGSGSDQQSVGKRKYSKIDYQQQTGDDLSFEGPKPLEEILKRKRGSETAVFGGSMTSHNTEDSNQHEIIESSKPVRSQSRNDSNSPNHNENEDYMLASGVKVRSEGAQSGDSHSLSRNTNEAELEEGMIIEDGAENQEPEAYDHGDEDSDYEQGGGDNYNLDEGENGDGEEEYLDDDDGDDFAKKMGVMY